MSDNNNSASPLQKGINVANNIRGAVKAGKAIAAASKGASVGGVYGAAAGVLWKNKDTVIKIVIAVSAFLLIPIIVICMLPSVIFGGMNNSDTPILNDYNAINQNITEISEKINFILAEALNDVVSEIEADFINVGADYKETVYPYDNSLNDNVYSFISQYCASKNEDYTSVSIDDMENIIKQNKHKLYSYTCTLEERKDETENIWNYAVYNIIYNGEDYFADEIFNLTDKQKVLAEDYKQNLILFTS